jgi:hypothetical protein
MSHALRRVAALVLVGAGLAAGGVQAAELPFAEPVTVTGVPEPPVVKPSVRRVSRVLVGQVVTIAEPLFTNGGDVLIVADRLVVRAPIDTRVRLEPTVPFHNPAPSLHPPFRQPETAVFREWFLWHQAYDPARRTYTYRAGTLEEYEAGQIRLTSMPYGRMAADKVELTPTLGYRVDGADAPEGVNRAALKSGDIVVYAREIEFCAECRRPAVRGMPVPNGDPGDAEEVLFFNAAGLRGGRAGLGSFVQCTWWGGGLNCSGLEGVQGGLSGKPSRGGDAGQVQVNFVGPDSRRKAEAEAASAAEVERCRSSLQPCADFAARLGQSVAALTNVAAGAPAHVAILRTPSWSVLSTRRERSILQPEAPSGRDQAALTGEAGRLTIRAVPADLALGEIGAALSAFDARAGFELAETVVWVSDPANRHPASAPRAPASPVARRMLSGFMADVLLARQSALVANLVARVDPRTDTPIVPADMLTDMACGATPAGLLDREAELVRALCLHKPVEDMGALRAFFVRAGGLLRPSEFRTFSQGDLQQQQFAASQQQIILAAQSLQGTVQALTGLIHARFTEETRERYRQGIDKLQTALADAVKNLEQARAGVNRNIFEALFEAGKALQADMSAASEGIASGDYGKAAPGLWKVGSGLVSFFSGADLALANARAAQAGQEAEALSASLAEAKTAFEFFERMATAERERQFAERAATLRDLINANQTVETIRIGLRVRFEDMLRGVLVAYVADRSDNNGRLASHAGAIREVMQNFPEGPIASLATLDEGGCAGQQPTPFERMRPRDPAGCAAFGLGQTPYMIATGAEQRLANFPLVVVAAGEGAYVLSLRLLYLPRELVRRGLPSGL